LQNTSLFPKRLVFELYSEFVSLQRKYQPSKLKEIKETEIEVVIWLEKHKNHQSLF